MIALVKAENFTIDIQSSNRNSTSVSQRAVIIEIDNDERGVICDFTTISDISFEAILYKNIRIFYKDYLSNGVVEILEEPQIK